MGQIKNYRGIIECFPSLKREFLDKERDIPNLSVICLEDYILEYESKNDYLLYIVDKLNKLEKDICLSENKKIYLCIATSKNTDNVKIVDYYKLWKTVKQKYIIDNFNLGYELRMQIYGQILYAGCAEVDYKYLKAAIEILYDFEYQSQAFIYVTSNNNLLLEESTINLFETISKKNNKKIEKSIYDYANLYCYMQEKDIVINFANDGEVIDLFIAQKQF